LAGFPVSTKGVYTIIRVTDNGGGVVIARVVLTAAQVVMVTAALKAIAVSGPVIASIFVGVEISVWLSFAELEVFRVIQGSEQGFPLFPGVIREGWEVFICHVEGDQRCGCPSTSLVVGELVVGC
jgi:hypothetical protein